MGCVLLVTPAVLGFQ